jgi:hypothetical protein
MMLAAHAMSTMDVLGREWRNEPSRKKGWW